MNTTALQTKLRLRLTHQPWLGTVFYYAFWAVMLYAKALNLTSEHWLLRACVLAAGGFWGLKFLVTRWDTKSAVVTTLLCVLGVLTYFGSGDTGILFSILAITGAKDVNLNELIRFVLYLKVLIFAATVLMAVTGIVENVHEIVQTNEEYFLKDRYYLGFIHPNYCHASLFVILALYSYLNFRKIGIWHVMAFLALDFLLYLFTASRTGLFLIIILCALVLILRNRTAFRLGRWVGMLLPILLAGVCFLFGSDRVYFNATVQEWDFALSGRITGLYIYLNRFPLTLFGNPQVMAYMDNNNVLDNFYVRLLLQYGTVAFAVFLLGTALLLAKLYREGRASCVMLVLVFLILGMLEHFTQDAFLNVSLLFFIYGLYGPNVREFGSVSELDGDMTSYAIPKQHSLVYHFFYYFIYTLLNVVIPLVTIIYVSRILGSDGVGQVSFAQSIVSYFVIVASLGIPNYATREIAKVSSQTEKNRLYSELFLINLCSTAICIVLYFGMVGGMGYFRENFPLYGMVGVQLVLNIFNVDWLYRGTEEYRYITASSMLVKFVCLFAMFQFVVDRDSVEAYALISSIALAGGYLFNFFHAGKLCKLKFRGVSVARHLKPVLVLFATQVAIELYILLDTTMLGILRTDAEVGNYTNASKLIKTTVSVITTLGGILLPRLSYYYEHGKTEDFHAVFGRVFRLLVLITPPAMLGMYALSDTITLAFFGSGFYPAVQIMMIFCPLLVIMPIGNLFGTQLLMVVGQEKRLMYSVFLGAGSNLIMNAVLIPLTGAPGAALASVISELLVMLAQVYFCRGYYKVSLPPWELFSTVLATLVMVAAVTGIKMLIGSYVIELIVSLIVGVAAFLLLGLILRNPMLWEGVAAVKGALQKRLHARGERT